MSHSHRHRARRGPLGFWLRHRGSPGFRLGVLAAAALIVLGATVGVLVADLGGVRRDDAGRHGDGVQADGLPTEPLATIANEAAEPDGQTPPGGADAGAGSAVPVRGGAGPASGLVPAGPAGSDLPTVSGRRTPAALVTSTGEVLAPGSTPAGVGGTAGAAAGGHGSAGGSGGGASGGTGGGTGGGGGSGGSGGSDGGSGGGGGTGGGSGPTTGPGSGGSGSGGSGSGGSGSGGSGGSDSPAPSPSPGKPEPSPSEGGSSSAPPPDVTAPETSARTAGTDYRLWEVELGADEPATFTCELDGVTVSCGPSTTFELRPGRHTLAARATDDSGNTDPSPATLVVVLKGKGAYD